MALRAIKVVYVQDGARLHYAQPLALHLEGVLCALYTDWYNDRRAWATATIGIASGLWPDAARRMRERRLDALDGVPVYQHRFLAIFRPMLGDGRAARLMAAAVRARLRQMACLGGPLAGNPAYPDAIVGPVHCFTPKMVRSYQSCGIRVVLDQVISPPREVARQHRLQATRWAQWQPLAGASDMATGGELEERTLRAADKVVGAADYVAEGLLEMGLAPDKLSVLPYPLEAGRYPFVDRSGRAGPLVVGFLGTANLRKGIPWLVETLKLLDRKLFRCVVVGPSALSDFGMAELKKVAEFVGPVPRGEVAGWMEKFDLFFFPSTCEGWGAVVAEAMATGLPIVTSPAGGSIVREGIDGFVRPYDQAEEYAKCIALLAKDPGRRLEMGHAARQRIEGFSVRWYGEKLAGDY